MCRTMLRWCFSPKEMSIDRNKIKQVPSCSRYSRPMNDQTVTRWNMCAAHTSCGETDANFELGQSVFKRGAHERRSEHDCATDVASVLIQRVPLKIAAAKQQNFVVEL